MFSFALTIGIYSYLILSIGLLGILTKQAIIIVTILVFFASALYFRKSWKQFFEKIGNTQTYISFYQEIKKDKARGIYILLLILIALVNFLGALGPELAFDALWYHITLPKLYLLHHSIDFIPGGLFYYSVMPRLTEMLYTAAVAIDSEILAKIIHFGFGLLCCLSLYTLSRLFFSKKQSLFAVVLFYSNLVVDWESITAYIDLARTFFEITALLYYFYYISSGKKRFLYQSAITLGLALCTKTLALGSEGIFAALIIYEGIKMKKSLLETISEIVQFALISFSIALPWYTIALLNTGNPFYPLFNHYETHQTLKMVINPIRAVQSFWDIFTHSPDPISPLYLIIFPLLFFRRSKFPKFWGYIAVYAFFSLVIWYVTPQSGGGRFILPYLPVLSLLVISVVRYRYPKRILAFIISLLLITSTFSIVYRGIANAKYIPVITGFESKDMFLKKNLHFDFGDFYDTDHFFARNIKATAPVLLYGFHNEYYVNFPFIDSSFVKPGDRFMYIAVQGDTLPPKRFRNWQLYYINKDTHVKVYTYYHHLWIY